MKHDEVRNHPYHILEPSPWPMLASISAGIMFFGLVLFMHSENRQLSDMVVFFTGLLGVLFVMFRWFSDVITESQVDHNRVIEIGLRYGVALFIASELMFFVAFFWAFFHNAFEVFSPGVEQWPPAGIEVLDPWDIPFLNTLILLLSGTSLTWAHHALLSNDRRGLVQGLALTVGLGVIFLCLQIFEYSHATFAFDQGIYSSVFYMATGFHGFHVFVGAVFLIVCWVRAVRGHFTPERHFSLEAAAWYWHFVDVVWLFLFVAVYVWGSAGVS